MEKSFRYIPLNNMTGGLKNFDDFNTRLEASLVYTRLQAGLSTDIDTVRCYTENQKFGTAVYTEWLINRGYLTYKFDRYVDEVGSVFIRDSHKGYGDTLIYARHNENSTFFRMIGDAVEIATIIQWMKTTFPMTGASITTATNIDSHGRVITQNSFMIKERARIAHDSFYPWLNISLNDYFKAFMEADESVLLLIGHPGTGKSTFLRSLILSGGYSTMLAYNKEVVESPKLIVRFQDSNSKILAYEDIDQHVKSRDDDNLLMSTILNASEGVVRHPGKKIIFSTNLPDINKIDPALIRVGRCFDIVEFQKLTPDQANRIVADVGDEPRDFSSKDLWSLTEVLNKPNPARQTINRFGQRTGFLK